MERIIHTYIVIPVYNEEDNILKTCQSLGFSAGDPGPKNCSLVLVDNNSTDDSASRVLELANSVPDHSIHLTKNNIQGIVQTRHVGNEYARLNAEEKNHPLSRTLIIQADADTLYSLNYTSIIKKKAENSGPNVIIEALTDYPESYIQLKPYYLVACQKIDEECQHFFCPDEEDIILDDKAIAYRLSDYYKWGGHKVAVNKNNEELLAESTRLYMTAKLFGAKRIRIASARVVHSVRVILMSPELIFATAGFPRERSWVVRFHAILNGTKIDGPYNASLQNIRRLHLLAIFCILPAHYSNTLNYQWSKNSISLFAIKHLPKRSINEENFPWNLIEDVFDFVDGNKVKLLNLISEP